MATRENTADTNQHRAEHDAIFAQEQAHLSETYRIIEDMEANTLALMGINAKNAEEDKYNMADELASNFASEGEAQETYVEYANMNTVIDNYNRTQAAYAEKLSAIRILKPQPYFAKIVLKMPRSVEPKELYIGNAGLSNDRYRRLIVDWRSPVAEVYYNQSNGATSYEANGRTINCELLLRRQFDVDHDTLNACFDTTVAIQDELLLASLTRQRTAQMQAITTTIQKEQNVVIRHADVPALLVNGVAGSGKTSVLLQRIAYLFYQQRETLDPRQVILVTPNPVFRTYIDNVLPDMGERNPRITTWAEFERQLTPPGREFAPGFSSLETFHRIDEALEGLEFNDKDFRDIKSNGVVLITAQVIARTAAKFKNVPAGAHRITLMREELETRLTSRLGQMAGSNQYQDEVSLLSHNEQLRLFGEPIVMDTEEQARDFTLRYLNLQFASAFEAVANDHWLRVDRIGRRLVGMENPTFDEWMYLKVALTGAGNPDAKYVMVDEVQDYTETQLMVLARYFRRAKFLLLGDANQAIKPSTASFPQIRALFEAERKEVSECHLMTSYRSTPAITRLFAKLADTDDGMQINSVQRSDTEPAIIECSSMKEHADKLKNCVEKALEQGGTTAVIAATPEEAAELHEALEGKAVLVDEAHSLPGNGAAVLDLALAKGLEFDHVIIANASQQNFDESALSKRRLYTAISRATATVDVLSNGPLTQLLK